MRMSTDDHGGRRHPETERSLGRSIGLRFRRQPIAAARTSPSQRQKAWNSLVAARSLQAIGHAESYSVG